MLITSCSVKKDTWSSRTYHAVTTRYNVYFNGRESHRQAVLRLETDHKEDFTQILPIFIYGDEAAAKSIYPDEDICIEKCSKAIDRHSMEIKGKQLNKWIDDSYFLMGQAHFYKQDYGQAKDVFEFVAKQYKDEEIHFDALVWLARTHIERKKFSDAQKILKLIENENAFPDRLKKEFRLVYADYYLKQKNYDYSIIELERALMLTKKRKEKTRLMYILAQLHQKEENAYEANKYYSLVIKNHPPYEMEFYAKINMAMAFDGGNSADIKETLRKMLKDKKNIDYYDQIYYALGELALTERQREEAIDLFIKSTRSSTDNNTQKAKSFLKLADMHFEVKDYRPAQQYFDSTIVFLATDYYRYDEVLRLKNSLGMLVKNIMIIEREDSLQRLAALSEEELEEFIEEQIEAAIKEEKRLQEAAYYEEQERLNRMMNQGDEARRMSEMSGDNSWYFYNETSKTYGAQEFKKLWGNRANEDNWRRSNKVSGGFDGELDMEAMSDEIPPEPTLNQRKDKNFYLASIPNTPEKIEASNKKLKDAHFELGSVYKESMQDIPKAIETFEALVARFDTSEHHPAAYYQLYLLYKNEGDMVKADYYKNKLTEEFFFTDYAKLAENPNYLDQVEESSAAVTDFYKKSLAYYNNGYYSQALASCIQAEENFPVNHLESKFKFLKALSSGKSSLDRAALIADLEALQKEFPSSDEAKEAKEIVLYLTNPPKIEEAVEEKPEANFEKYKYAMESNHTVILIVPENANTDKIKTSISNFNREFFRTTPLNVNAVYLDKTSQMVSVKLFKNSELAMDYYKAFQLNGELLKEINEKNYPIFVISYENYPTFYKDKNVYEYRAFFEAVYIEGQVPEQKTKSKEKPAANPNSKSNNNQESREELDQEPVKDPNARGKGETKGR